MMDVYDDMAKLTGQSPHARMEAVGRLSTAGEMAIGPLLSMLLDAAQPPHARACAAKALGNIGSPKAVDGLIGALQDPEMVVRCPAAMALGKLGEPKAALPLSESLSDESFFVRKFAACSLVGIIRRCSTPENLLMVLGAIGGNVPDEGRWHPKTKRAMARLMKEIDTAPAKLMARCSGSSLRPSFEAGAIALKTKAPRRLR